MKWEKVKLEDVCISIADGDHQPPPKAEQGVPFITISNFTQTNQLDFSNTMFVPQDYYDALDSKRQVQKGDILYSVVGSFGIPVFVRDDLKFVFQRHIAILRPNSEIIHPEFLYYLMLSRDFYMIADSVALGAAQRTISLKSLRNIKIDIPSLEIQSKIASILSNYDNLIENNQKQIKLLEEAAQRLYREWFVDLRFPGHETVNVVDGVPDGWRYDSIDSKISFLSGYAFKSSTFSDNGKYKIVTIKNVQENGLDGTNVSTINDIPDAMPRHCVLNDGDILLSLTGNIGRVCRVSGENYLLNQRVAKLDSCCPMYTYCLFKSKEMFDSLNILSNGVAQQNLSPVRAGKMKHLFPSEILIEEFERITSPLFEQVMKLNRMNGLLIEARDRLLPKLMSGELEV